MADTSKSTELTPEEEAAKDEADLPTKTVHLFRQLDGIRGRGDGVFMDREDERAAEVRRARAEDREPDLDNPPPTVGTPLVTAAQLTDNLVSNPHMLGAPGPEAFILDHIDDDDYVSPVAEVEVVDHDKVAEEKAGGSKRAASKRVAAKK